MDIAEEMLNVARKRFAGLNTIDYQICNYAENLPYGEFDCIISALSIHHLENEMKQNLFSRIYNKLPDDGIFVNYDQFSGGSPVMDEWFDSYWEKQLEKAELSSEDMLLWKERRKLDRECSVEEEIDMLKNVGFHEVKLVYCNQKFCVIIAKKEHHN